MKGLFPLLIFMFIYGPVHGKQIRQLKDHLDKQLTAIGAVLNEIEEEIPEGPNQAFDGWALNVWRIKITGIFGWKLPFMVTLTLNPMVDLFFFRKPTPL